MSGERGATETNRKGEQPKWRRYLRLFGTNVTADVDDEFEFHIQTRAAEYVAQGLTEAEARARTLREFGDIAAAKAQCRDIDEAELRRHRRTDWLGELRQDIRFAVRVLSRSPGFTIAAVVTLAIGIGANTAIFSIANGVLFRPLPYAQPSALVRIWETTPQGQTRNVVSPGNFIDWRTRARSFTQIGVHRNADRVGMTGDGEPTQVVTTDASPEAMSVLGVAPALGRLFTPEESRAGERLALLGDGFWRRRFGADPAVIGRRIELNAIAYTIVGVMPASFSFPSDGVEVYRMIREAAEVDPNERRSHNWLVVGRLRSGVALAQAQAEMRGLAAAITSEYPQFMTGYGVNVVSLHADLVGNVRPILLVLLAGSALVLLIACANVGNLLLARALAREREMAVRGALGAGRSRLARQLLTESLVLGAAAGVLGLLTGAAFLRILLFFAPPDIPRLAGIGMQPIVLTVMLGATLVCVALFGLVPALRMSRVDLQSTLRAGRDRSGGVHNARLRAGLLIGEIALSLVLLVGAGLLLRSAQRLSRVDYGYRPEDLLIATIDLPRARYLGSEAHVRFYEQLVERARGLPGALSAAGTSEPPASGYSMTFSFAIEGRPSNKPSGREDPHALHAITPEYFRTLGIPLLRGRAFDSRDRADAPLVTIVNRSFATRYWPTESPVGKRISFRGAEGPWMEIVGVVGDTRMTSADLAPEPAFYVPHAQKAWQWMSWLSVVVRIHPGTDLEALTKAMRALVWEIDGQLPIQRITTVQDLYGESTARRRFATSLLGAFAAVALLLGTIGMYGVLAYAVAQRRQEIGIRIALGADSRRVMGEVIRHALTLAVVGVAAGTLAALALTQYLQTLLYEVSPNDPGTFVLVAVVLGTVAAAAAWVPARRATRIDPLVAMRDS